MSLVNAAPEVLAPDMSCRNGLISELLLSSGRGDEAAFARLLDLVYPLVAAAAAVEVAAAAAVEIAAAAAVEVAAAAAVEVALVSVWRAAPTYRPGAVSAVDWIVQVATNA
jgi:hypothetical protein